MMRVVCLLCLWAISALGKDTLTEDTCATSQAAFTLNPTAKAMITGLFAMRLPGTHGDTCGETSPGECQLSLSIHFGYSTVYVKR